MARTYPEVVGEFDTISKLLEGFSIARFGDGEVKLMSKHVYTRELVPVPKLAAELKRITFKPHKRCLVGIWNLDPAGTKYQNLLRHKERFSMYFHTSTGIKYYSSLITRPDTGAWLETREYYEHVSKLWARKRHLVVVSELDSKLLSHLRHVVPQVTHVECPMYGAYAEIDRLEKGALAAGAEMAVLSCGVTATALAHRLCQRGLQALDLGSIGGFLERWRLRQPKPENYAEERANNKEAMKPHGVDAVEC